MKVGIVGAGYVGLIQALVMAGPDIQVVCCDSNERRVDELSDGIMPFEEPGADELLMTCIDKGCIEFTTSMEKLYNECDIIFICVGTPSGEDGSCDTQYIYKVCGELASLDANQLGMVAIPRLVVMKSTVPVGTNARMCEMFFDTNLFPISSPEFLREGQAIEDSIRPDRNIIGVPEDSRSDWAFERLAALYRKLSAARSIRMSAESAEMVKYVANSYLATRISFFNEMAVMCSLNGADVFEMLEGVTTDNRIGHKFTNPGIGFGGACFPKDVSSLHFQQREMGMPGHILSDVLERNRDMRLRFFQEMIRTIGILNNRTVSNDIKIGVLGATFKANTSDCRESPAVAIIDEMANFFLDLIVHDPMPKDAKELLKQESITWVDHHHVFEREFLVRLNETKISRRDLKEGSVKHLFDGRNDASLKKTCEELGISYYAIGSWPNVS